ncbi:UxaA family hydrolase [Sphingobacterium sp. SYP-B4668]|uniref:UxaA family hydrolase n=1 Tax=Sphingobacterium sp. SYP-B4668 TaxID=2996035 RepID=UPI0022DE671C|nr:UxaA family hydrolase [Sphingobacterium sp. SYP-B4668]
MRNLGLAYLRKDGRKGIRNIFLVAYLVECAHHIAKKIASRFDEREVHLIGFSGCYPNQYAEEMMHALCKHPNVGGVLLVSLGCESFNNESLYHAIQESGRPVKLISIQQEGGTSSAIALGTEFVSNGLEQIRLVPRVEMRFEDLVVGVVSGGSDATSGLTANPATGLAFDRLVASGATAIFENTGEMVGLEDDLYRRAIHPALGDRLRDTIVKAAHYYAAMGHGSFAPGNAAGGLSTLEEKSIGAYCKSGSSRIVGLLKPCDLPLFPGLYLLDIVPDGPPTFGFPNPNDISEINELIASGAQCVLFTTGRGSVAGSAIAPVIKICANPETYSRMHENMDINAGKILSENCSLDAVADEILEEVIRVVQGKLSCAEQLGHFEFSLGYKFFEPLGPSCLS